MLERTKIILKPYLDFIKYRLEKIGIKYNRIIFFEKLTKEDIPSIKTKIPVDIRIASKKDLDSLGKIKNEALNRLNEGDICFLAISHNKVAGYSWISLKNKIYIPEIENYFKIENDSVYQYAGTVFQEFKKNGFHKKLIEENLKYVKSKHLKKLYTFVAADNIISQKVVITFNANPVKSVSYLRIFCFRKYKETNLR